MNEKLFKKKYKYAMCTCNPTKHLIPYAERYDAVRKMKQECLEVYGEDRSSECGKRLTCFTKQCTGRTSFWDSKTALPYLNKLKQLGVINNDGDMYVTGCNDCPIKNICTMPCYMVHDYTKRNYNKEPFIIYKDNIDNYERKYENVEEVSQQSESLSIPWDCLSPRQALIVRKYMYEQKDFERVARDVGMCNQSEARYYFYSALNLLSEVAVMRRFLAKHKQELTKTQKNVLKFVYLKNKTLTETAKQYKISKQSVGQTIKRLVINYGIKWERFVYKRGNRIRYNIPNLLK